MCAGSRRAAVVAMHEHRTVLGRASWHSVTCAGRSDLLVTHARRGAAGGVSATPNALVCS